MASALALTRFSPAASSDPQGHTASSQTVDPASVLQLNYATLAEATTDPLWLANQLFGEGILDYHIKNELETTDKSSYDKATRLWGAVMTSVKHQGNPTQTLLRVCHMMKQRRELARLAESMISQLGSQGSQQGDDDTVVEMESGVTESVPRRKDLVRDVAHSPDIPREQPSVTSDVGGDDKAHGYSNTKLSAQEMCLGIAKICYAMDMTYNVLYVMHTIYGMNGTLFCFVSGVLLLQFLWALVHRESKKLIAGLVVTAAYFEVLLAPVHGILRFNIVSQFPIYVEVLDYCKKEAIDFILLMFVFLFNFFPASFILLTAGKLVLIVTFIEVVYIWSVHVFIIYLLSRVMFGLIYSYAPIIVFIIIFEVFLYNMVDLSSSFNILNHPNLLLGQKIIIVILIGFIIGLIMTIGTWLVINHPVSTDQIHVYCKKTWRIIVTLMPLKQLFFLLLYSELPSFIIAIIVIIVIVISVILSLFSSRRVLMSVASVLIVLVLINTLHTYKFWSVPDTELATALHGFLSQFSLVGGLFYTIAYEL